MNDVSDAALFAVRLGDDALVLAQRLTEWAAAAPTLEEDVALLNLALDLLGQARSLLSLAGDEDELAMLRDERAFTNCQLVEQPIGDFGATMARQLLFAAWAHPLWQRLCTSTDPDLAAVAGKAVKEVAYHLDHARSWVVRLGDGTPESHARMQAGLEVMWPYAAELFERDELVDRLVEANVIPDPAVLQAVWRRTIADVLAEATLVEPETTWAPTGGRQGRHTSGFGLLLAELQYVARSHPGATW